MVFLEFALESSLLVLMILGIRKIFTGKVQYAGIYALWLLVLLRFLVPVNFISTPFSAGAVIPQTFSAKDGSVHAEQGVVRAESGTPAGETEGKAAENSELAEEVQAKGGTVLQKPGAEDDNARRTKGYMFLKISWIAVSALLFCWFAVSNVCLTRRLKKSRVLYGRKGKIKIYTACGIQNPCLYGFFRPAVYLPKAFVAGDGGGTVDKEEIRQMILHEYVHYRHGDHIWAMFRVLLVSVYWFDPFLWLAVSCSKKDAELCCDETVIRVLGEERRFRYGEMLVRLAGDVRWGEFRYPVMSMSRRGKEMEKRILAISRKKKYSRWLAVPLVILVLVAAGITCSAAGSKPAGENARTEEEGIRQAESASGAAGAPHGETIGQNEGTNAGDGTPLGGDTYEETLNVDTGTVEKAFDQYIAIFTDAVNTGNTDRMYQVLPADSDVYAQQCAIVKNYYKRGIREKVKTYSITSKETVTPQKELIYSKEKIRVSYADGTAKTIRQKYCYTCELAGDGRWMITGMEDLSEE